MSSQTADSQTPDHVYDPAERPDWPVRRHTPRPSSVPLNAKKHGLCAKTIILDDEDPEEFDRLHDKWRREYGNPDDDDLIAELVFQVVVSDWTRRRAVRWYDELMVHSQGPAIFHMTGELLEQHDRTLRYKTTLERAFHRDYRMLESHYKARVSKQERAEIARKGLPPKANTTSPQSECLLPQAHPASPQGERLLPMTHPANPPGEGLPPSAYGKPTVRSPS